MLVRKDRLKSDNFHRDLDVDSPLEIMSDYSCEMVEDVQFMTSVKSKASSKAMESEKLQMRRGLKRNKKWVGTQQHEGSDCSSSIENNMGMKRTKRFLNLDNPYGKLSQSSQSREPSSPSSFYGSLFKKMGAAYLGNEQNKEEIRGSDRILS